MLIDKNIKNIIGGGYNVSEVKYMDKTVWKKDIEMIITNLDDAKYFYINDDGCYQLINKPEYQFMSVYVCEESENKSLLTVYRDISGIRIGFSIPSYAKRKSRAYNHMPNKNYHDSDYNSSYGHVLDYYIKILIPTPLSKTVILVNHINNYYDLEAESKVVIEKFETL